MTVNELIEHLKRFEDKNAQVQVAIRQYNQDYPVAYCGLTKNSISMINQSVRLTIHLPGDEKSFMYTGTRKTR